MEAPTPVSALLHAGVVNIGGFVMIRLAPLMAHAYIAQGILLGVGLFTTIVAALVMTTRVAIKGVLAWSTIGQMGFMLVQCGLGAWHLALMHLLAHSLYKAHTFLSSGSVVQQWRAAHLVHSHAHADLASRSPASSSCAVARRRRSTRRPSFRRVTCRRRSAPLALVLGLSFAPMIGRAIAAGRRAVRARGAVHGGSVGRVLRVARRVRADRARRSMQGLETSTLKWTIVVAGLVVLFIAQSILQTSPNGRFANWLQPHLVSGLYIDDWFTRVTFRLWPPGFR